MNITKSSIKNRFSTRKKVCIFLNQRYVLSASKIASVFPPVGFFETATDMLLLVKMQIGGSVDSINFADQLSKKWNIKGLEHYVMMDARIFAVLVE